MDQSGTHMSCQQMYKDPFGKVSCKTLKFCWHERSALQSVAVRQSTGNDISGPLFSPFFFIFQFFFSVATFSYRRSARIQKLIWQKWLEMANNLGLDPFPEPVGHFGAPWRPFWIFEVLIEGMMESKNLFSES